MKTSLIRDKVSNLQDETLLPLTFGGITESIADSDDDQSYHPGNNDSYDSELENDGDISNESISLISDGEENDLLMDNVNSIDTKIVRLLQMIDPDGIYPFDPSSFDEDEIDFIPSLQQKDNNIPLFAKAQLDLLQILKKLDAV